MVKNAKKVPSIPNAQYIYLNLSKSMNLHQTDNWLICLKMNPTLELIEIKKRNH